MKIRSKTDIIYRVISIEGGYVNNPNDSGGETKYGITKRVAIENGYKGSMKELGYETAFNIYEKEYWNALKLDTISDYTGFEVSNELFDTAVNMGVKRSAQFFQRALNLLNRNQSYYPDLKVDSKIGPNTLRNLNALLKARKDSKRVLYNMLNCMQGNFYIELAERRPKDETFIYGWFKHRIDFFDERS